MKIEVLQEHLIQALNQLQKILPSKPQLPILSAFLLTAQNNEIQLSATDLFLGMKTTVLGKVVTEGTIAIPGKIFRDYISSLSAGKVGLELEGTSLKIMTANNSTTIQCITSDEYPAFPEVEGEEKTLSVKTLQEIENLVRFAASLDPTRPVLTTLLFQFKETGLEVVSTDGFRLTTLVLAENSSKTINLLLPAKAMSEITRISSQSSEEKITFIVDEKNKQVLFEIENTKIYVRLIEGEYPPYQKIIPGEFKTTIVVDGAELEEQVKRAMIFSRDTANIIKFSIENKQLIVSATSPAYGTHQGEITAEMKNGEAGVIAFNARYVLDFLTTAKPTKIEFSMNESLTPAQLRPEGKSEYRYIVMPFRVNE